ncbi:hypothetical protein Z949_866 [Sulfitobacter guttiformis KCTC 32187]|nr:hypothetical protein Z949_866 [Sulfitobacter guttiformis KCTC 32187]
MLACGQVAAEPCQAGDLIWIGAVTKDGFARFTTGALTL